MRVGRLVSPYTRACWTSAALAHVRPQVCRESLWESLDTRQDETVCSMLGRREAQELLNRIRVAALCSLAAAGAADTTTSTPRPLAHRHIDEMGSFTCTAQVTGGDRQDEQLEFPPTSLDQLIATCSHHLTNLPQPFNRTFRSSTQHTSPHLHSNQSLHFRVFQWNHLSQTLGTKNDKFVNCPPEALAWETRRWRLLEEILRYRPDVICLQEVDHFRLLSRALASVGYSGRFVPKPDSPCIYLEENNGPDGCAIFVLDDKFEILSETRRILEVWNVQSNQVVLGLNLRDRLTGQEVMVATTHLKARHGALLSTLRNEQGKDLLAFLGQAASGRPVVLAGDFNAGPSEPVFQTLTSAPHLPLRSAYELASFNHSRLQPTAGDTEQEQEDFYTTWKIRETGEQKQILDYIFHSEELVTAATLEMPTEAEIGPDRLPSLQFASDHLSLVADFVLSS